ncbi:MAG: helix-turn-helix domain-containing protein [Fimbriimonadaceae bacterium]
MQTLKDLTAEEWIAFGARLKSTRQEMGLSLRALAEKAGVDKNTLMRVEKGTPTRRLTLDVICVALGTSVQRQLLALRTSVKPFCVARADDIVWTYSMASKLSNLSSREVVRTVANADQRRELGFSGAEHVFNGLYPCHIEGGTLLACLVEVYSRGLPISHPGEELCMCLRGSVLITVLGETFRLDRGDVGIFMGTDEHYYEPAEPVRRGRPVPLVLTVRSR